MQITEVHWRILLANRNPSTHLHNECRDTNQQSLSQFCSPRLVRSLDSRTKTLTSECESPRDGHGLLESLVQRPMRVWVGSRHHPVIGSLCAGHHQGVKRLRKEALSIPFWGLSSTSAFLLLFGQTKGSHLFDARLVERALRRGDHGDLSVLSAGETKVKDFTEASRLSADATSCMYGSCRLHERSATNANRVP